MTHEALALEAWPLFLVFARLGSALMLTPGFGEHQVTARLRLLLALALSLLLAPALPAAWPPLPPQPLALLAPLAREIVVGLLIGLSARLALTALHVGGSLLALQSGLSSAAMLDPNEGLQSMLPASFLTAAALALLFAAGFHHLILRGLAASYAILPAGTGLDLAAAGELLARLGGMAIAIGFRLAAPLIVAGLVVNLALGVLGRMVPSLPLLSLALPAQLLLAMLVIELSLPEAMALFAQGLKDTLAWLGPGAAWPGAGD